MAQVIPAYTTQFEEMRFARRPWGATVKNFFLGTLGNWQEHALTVGAVYYVAQSVFFLIGGYWLYSFVALCTALLSAKIRKDLREFADLRKETADYRDQNNVHRMTNLQQKEITRKLEKHIDQLQTNVDRFTTQLTELEEERKRFEESNDTYSHHNRVHEGLLQDLGDKTKQLVRDFKEAAKERYEGDQEALESFAGKLQELQVVKIALEEASEAIQDNSGGLDEAAERLKLLADKIQDVLVTALAEFSNLFGKITGEVKALTKIREEIQEATRLNLEAAKESRAAAQQAHQSSNILRQIFDSIIFQINYETGKRELNGTTIMVLAIAGAVAAKYFNKV